MGRVTASADRNRAATRGCGEVSGVPTPSPSATQCADSYQGFLQPDQGLAPVGRPVTAAALRRSSPAFAPDACAAARAHRRGRLPGPLPAAARPASRAAAAGIPDCTFSEPLPPTPLVRTTDGTRSSVDVPAPLTSGSSTIACTSPNPADTSVKTDAGVDLVTAAKWLSSSPPPKELPYVGPV
jgi:hypothetical protein